jgi:ribosomal protein S18 acetylase RimI-like enzyme
VDRREVVLRDGRSCIVRRANLDDAETLMANTNSIAVEGIYISREEPLKDLGAERDWIAGMDGRRRVLYVAEVGGRVVGAADVRSSPFKKEAHTRTLGIAIIREFRGLGIGKALMEACLDFCRRTEVEKVSLEVFSTNKAAISLYTRMGFELECVHRGKFKIRGEYVDEWSMSLWLRGPPGGQVL